MTSPAVEPLLGPRRRGDWVRLRTMIALRWIAVAGQTAALLAAWKIVGVELDFGLCALAIGASATANLVAMFAYPQNTRLSETEAMLAQLFDIAQLSLLLYLTGGLNNPFAILVVVPVTISATALERRSTALLGAVAIVLVTVLAVFYRPLMVPPGGEVALPALLRIGFWAAIVVALVFLSAYAYRVSDETHSMANALAATQMALAREQTLTDLGGVVAAAAHELGTPLATIKLASAELIEELADRPELCEDAALIRAQADRCRDILQSMGRAGKDDLLTRSAPVSEVLREAAEPHAGRGRTIRYEVEPGGDATRQPWILRRPEVIHGLRNIVQNAVDFAAGEVWIGAARQGGWLTVRVEDDGPGFPPDMLGRLGDPYMRRRPSGVAPASRPGYDGMGLGLFIAKTLLERTGAEVSFANGSDPFLKAAERPRRGGAVVRVRWPEAMILAPPGAPGEGLGQNQRISA